MFLPLVQALRAAGLLVPSWAECPGRNYCAACSLLGGVPRAELLCCCAPRVARLYCVECYVREVGEAARHFVWLCVSRQYSDSSEYLSYALIRTSCAVL